jgi:hypothetical protein
MPIKPNHIALAALTLALAATNVSACMAQTAPTTVTVPAYPSAKTIDDLMAVIKTAKKPLPAWAVEIITRIYDAYKTHDNGKKVEAIDATVRAAILEVVRLKGFVEAGRELSAEEYRLTRELLDTQARLLSEFGLELWAVKQKVETIGVTLATHGVEIDKLKVRPPKIVEREVLGPVRIVERTVPGPFRVIEHEPMSLGGPIAPKQRPTVSTPRPAAAAPRPTTAPPPQTRTALPSVPAPRGSSMTNEEATRILTRDRS